MAGVLDITARDGMVRRRWTLRTASKSNCRIVGGLTGRHCRDCEISEQLMLSREEKPPELLTTSDAGVRAMFCVSPCSSRIVADIMENLGEAWSKFGCCLRLPIWYKYLSRQLPCVLQLLLINTQGTDRRMIDVGERRPPRVG